MSFIPSRRQEISRHSSTSTPSTLSWVAEVEAAVPATTTRLAAAAAAAVSKLRRSRLPQQLILLLWVGEVLAVRVYPQRDLPVRRRLSLVYRLLLAGKEVSLVLTLAMASALAAMVRQAEEEAIGVPAQPAEVLRLMVVLPEATAAFMPTIRRRKAVAVAAVRRLLATTPHPRQEQLAATVNSYLVRFMALVAVEAVEQGAEVAEQMPVTVAVRTPTGHLR